jgi:nucleotide sugar dehydrogenase
MKIVVIGYGWVGQANALALALMGDDVYFFDSGEPQHHYLDSHKGTYSQIKRLSTVLEIDATDVCYIVCVGDRVSPEGDQDISLIKEALNSLKGAQGKIILRSTILPGYLSDLHFDFYVPEFLHEKKAVEECLKPHYFVVGSRQSAEEPAFFQVWQKKAHKVFRGTPEEASYIKYLSNLWNSVRIAFVNEFGDVMHKPKTADDIHAIERVVDFIFGGKFYLRYGRSFGGHCLPKDTRAFFKYHADHGQEMPLLVGAYRANDMHQQLEQGGDVLPEWYSQWQTPEISGRVALAALLKLANRMPHKIVTRLKIAFNELISTRK